MIAQPVQSRSFTRGDFVVVPGGRVAQYLRIGQYPGAIVRLVQGGAMTEYKWSELRMATFAECTAAGLEEGKTGGNWSRVPAAEERA